MRWILLFAMVIAMAVLAYAATPLRAAWILSEAIREADHRTIDRRVQWDGVRSSLKYSLAEHPLLLKKATAVGSQVQPTVWQRVKSVMGASMLDRFIETYVSPEGLPVLAQAQSEDEASFGSVQRFSRFVARVKRIRFLSLTAVEFEFADQRIPERRYGAALELTDSDWKLVSVRVVAVEDDGSLLARH